MAYDVEDDFESERGYAIAPQKAERARLMFADWMKAIDKHFPDALNKGDPEDREIVMLGTAALLGELTGLVWVATYEELAKEVLEDKFKFAARKMAMVAAMDDRVRQ